MAAGANAQRGAVAVMVAVALVALLGFLGLVVDLGRMLVIKAELQNAADACALAAAQELDATPNALTRAENAGVTVGSRNLQNFQSAAVPVSAADIRFSTTLSSPAGDNSNYLTQAAGAPADSRYAMCSLTTAGIQMTISGIVGVGPQALAASAVATLAPSQSNCALPIGVCTKGPAPNYGLSPGQWINARFDTGGGATGSFNWIDFTPPGGGASEMTGLLTGQGVCNTAPTSTLVGQTGSMGGSQATAWNSRFGLYQNGAGQPQLATAPPDFTGYAYTPLSWPAQASALADFLGARRTANTPFQGNDGVFPPGSPPQGVSNNQNAISHAQHAQSGANRRLTIAPIIDCAGWTSAQTVPVLGYACVLMLHPMGQRNSDPLFLEYIGQANAPGTPCTTNGLAGGVGPLVPALVQ